MVSALKDDAQPSLADSGKDQPQMAEALVSAGNSGQSSQHTTSELRIQANSLGHFMVDSEVNGQPIRFLVDTGATKVALAAEDAERLGLSLDRLQYNEVYKTANGEVHAAPVTLRQIRIGQFVLRDVEAIVTDSPMNVSLLGMSYLGRLQSYEVRDNKNGHGLVKTQPHLVEYLFNPISFWAFQRAGPPRKRGRPAGPSFPHKRAQPVECQRAGQRGSTHKALKPPAVGSS